MQLEQYLEAVPNLLADILAAQRDTTEAITKLTEAIAGVRTKVEAVKNETQQAIAKAATKPGAPATPPAVPSSTATPAVSGPAITYEEARAAIAAIPRPKAIEILKGLGVAKLSELTADKFPAVIEACHG